MPPKPSAASACSSQTSDVEAGLGGELLGLLGQPGRVLEVGRHGGQHPRAPAGAAEGDGAGQLVVVRAVVVVDPGQHDPAHGLLGRPGRAPVEGEGAQRRTDHERRRAPPSGAMAVIEVTTLARSLVARATVAPARRKSVTGCSPRPDQQDQSVTVSDTTGTVVTSPVRPVARAASRRPRRSSPSSSDASSAPGPRSDVAVLAREDGQRPDLGAADLVRQGRAEGELRG